MRIEFNSALFSTPNVSGLKFNNGLYRASFGNVQPKDSFQSTSIAHYFSEDFIRSALSSNYELSKMLERNKIPARLNMKELSELKDGHMDVTRDICERIAQNLPPALKSNVNMKDLKEAAMLHDFGKVLIPSEILNKRGALSPEEYKIMNLHAEFGYQLLKKSGLNDNVLNLIHNHHNNLDSHKKFVYDVDLQVLNLADKYSALTEKRVYKSALTPHEALTILSAEVSEGKVHPMVFNALVKSVNSNPFASRDTINISTKIA